MASPLPIWHPLPHKTCFSGNRNMRDEDKTREELLTDLQRIRMNMAGMVEAEAFRRRAERELEQVTQIAAAIVRSSPCGLLVLQRQLPERLILVNANPQAARLMDLTLDEARGTDFDKVWPDFSELGFKPSLLNALDTGEPFQDDNVLYRIDSEERLFSVNAFRLPEDRIGMYLAEAQAPHVHEEIGPLEDQPTMQLEPMPSDTALLDLGLAEDLEEGGLTEEETSGTRDEELLTQVVELSGQVEELSAQLLAAQKDLAQETELRRVAEEAAATTAHELETRVKERTEEFRAANQSLERGLAESQALEEELRTIQYELEERLKAQELEIRELTETLEIEIEEHKKTEDRLVNARITIESRMTDADEELESANELLRDQLAERRHVEAELRSALTEREIFLHELSTRLSEATVCLDQETARRAQLEQSVSGVSLASHPLLRSRLGYGSFNTNGAITGFNPRLLEMLGASSGDDLREFNLLDSPLMNETGVSQAMKECLQSGAWSLYEGPFPDASGQHRIARIHMAPVRQDNDEMLGCEAIFEDVSADRLKEEHVIRSERLHALSRMAGPVGDAFSDIAQTISENAQAALACVESASLSDMIPLLEAMLGKSRDLGRTTRRIRQFARMRPRIETTAQSHVFDLTDVVKESIDMDALWSKPATTEGGCDVAVEPLLTPGCHVQGIEDDFIEVLANLLENAVEAVPAGGTISVKTSLDRDEVVLEVRDDGAGIPRNHLAKLFEPFWTTKDGHYGLGLCVVFGIVRRHSGTVSVYSEEGAGSTFTLRLPHCTNLPDEEGAPREESAQEHYRILLVYNLEPVARMVRNKLTRLGYSVFVAQSIHESIETLMRTKIDAIVVDFSEEDASLPDVIGAIRLLHMQTGLYKPPIITLTGSIDHGALSKLRDCPDLSRIVEKPVSVTRLGDIVAEEIRDADSNYPRMSW